MKKCRFDHRRKCIIDKANMIKKNSKSGSFIDTFVDRIIVISITFREWRLEKFVNECVRFKDIEIMMINVLFFFARGEPKSWFLYL